MPRPAEARSWWADVEDVCARIERRRARESDARRQEGANASAVRAPATRRGVREIRPGRHLMVVPSGVGAPGPDGPSSALHRRPRPRMSQRLGPRPDRVAAWAVVLGFASVIAAILSAHG